MTKTTARWGNTTDFIDHTWKALVKYVCTGILKHLNFDLIGMSENASLYTAIRSHPDRYKTSITKALRGSVSFQASEIIISLPPLSSTLRLWERRSFCPIHYSNIIKQNKTEESSLIVCRVHRKSANPLISTNENNKAQSLRDLIYY